jgi:L-fuconolactonase
MNVTRRQFMHRAAAAAAVAAELAPAVAASGAEASADPSPLPIIDTHEHLWDVTRLAPPWLKRDDLLNRSFVSRDYIEAIRGLNVVQSVYMEVDMDPAQQLAEAEYVIELCRDAQTPMRAAVIGGRPGDEGFRAYIDRFKGSPYVKGLRQILRPAPGQKGLPVPDRFAAGLRRLGELGMCFDLCIPPHALRDGAQLVDQCPDTRFVLDHCGNADPEAFRRPGSPRKADRQPAHDADQWRRDIAYVAQRKNVVCKISGIVSREVPGQWAPDDLAPIINHCLESFGPDRVMFAGDWPVCTRGATLRQWVEALRQVVRDRSQDQQRKLLHDNALAFYGLPSSGA